MRKVLLVVQFAISFSLIVGTIIIYNQMQYIQNKELGYAKEQVVVLDFNNDYRRNYSSLKQELLNAAGITSVSAATSLPTSNDQMMNIDWEGKSSPENVYMHNNSVDYDYLELFDIKLVAGRSFAKTRWDDSLSSFIINEKARKLMELKDPIGKKIYFAKGLPQYYQEGRIIGVVRDFHFQPMNQHIQPLVMRIFPAWHQYMLIKVKPQQVENTLEYIRSTTKRFSTLPLEYSFLDETFARHYEAEQNLRKVFTYLAVISILVSCLGAYGFASYVTELRMKEIGIRKVFGASEVSVLLLLYKNFAFYVAVAVAIASPVTYFLMHNWLNNFAFRTAIGVLPFVQSLFVILTILAFTVSHNIIKASSANPIRTLKQ